MVGQIESLSAKSDGNEELFALGGPQLENSAIEAGPIPTGQSTIISGGSLPCDWVIFSVGPKYDKRYLSASDQALFSAYKSALTLAASKNVKRLVLNCIYLRNKKYPRFEAAHVALRTVRKFLEHPSGVGNCFEKVMFCVSSQEDFEIYLTLMTAYFPRNAVELSNQFNLLPKRDELGDIWGQVIQILF